LRRRIIRSE